MLGQPASQTISGAVKAVLQIATREETYQKAQIHCQKCKTENPPTALRCQNCDANLLPGATVGQRVVLFFLFLLAAGLLGFLFYRFYIQEPGSAPDIVLCNQGALVGGAVLSFIMAFVSLFRRTAEYEKYVNRANRHLNLNAWQSLDDLNRAMDLAPEKEQMRLVKQRAKVFEKLGLNQDAARDHLSLVTSPNAYKGEGEWVSALTGADGDVFSSSMRSSQIKTMLSSGKVMAVGYCKRCKDVVELNVDQRCPIHPKDKGLEVELVIPSDRLAGNWLSCRNWSTDIHLEGKSTACWSRAGRRNWLCPRCKAVVQLDSGAVAVHSGVKGRKCNTWSPVRKHTGETGDSALAAD
jgi:ribosomal protein L40E